MQLGTVIERASATAVRQDDRHPSSRNGPFWLAFTSLILTEFEARFRTSWTGESSYGCFRHSFSFNRGWSLVDWGFICCWPTRAVYRMIEVEALTKLYGDFVAVNDLSFCVQPGEVLGLIGPNGAGKTTTLRSLAGIIPPTRGTIRICAHDLARDPIAAKRQLSIFTDEPRLFEYLTVQQHLAFVARIYQVADYEPIAQHLLEELELSGKQNALPEELSRGMKQKLAIACGLLHSPKVIYFDEPLTGLDPIGIRRMKDSILKRSRDGAAIIVSSHLLHLVQEICSHVLILKNGRKIIMGTMADITRQFSAQPGDTNLEDVFFKATENT